MRRGREQGPDGAGEDARVDRRVHEPVHVDAVQGGSEQRRDGLGVGVGVTDPTQATSAARSDRNSAASSARSASSRREARKASQRKRVTSSAPVPVSRSTMARIASPASVTAVSALNGPSRTASVTARTAARSSPSRLPKW